MTLEQARRFALSLPQTSEEPHFRYTSFRAGGRIFATAHPDGSFLHVFIPEEARERALVLEPAVAEKLFWGAKAVRLRVHLPKARAAFVHDLLRKAWEYKATKKPTRPRKCRSART